MPSPDDTAQAPVVGCRDNEPSATVFFDGACPLCTREIAHYRRVDRAGAICFVDVSAVDAPTPAGVDRQQALARFHIRAADGRLLSGAEAFVEVWARLPGWRWAARLARLPGVLMLLELGYRAFLPVRSYLARLFLRRPAA